MYRNTTLHNGDGDDFIWNALGTTFFLGCFGDDKLVDSQELVLNGRFGERTSGICAAALVDVCAKVQKSILQYSMC